MLATQLGVSPEEAFRRLCAFVRNHRQRLRDVAEQLTSGRLVLETAGGRLVARSPTPPAASPSLLVVDHAADGVRLHGEADVTGVPILRVALEHWSGGSGDVVVDLSDLVFMDCAAVGVLVSFAPRLEDARRLVLVGASRIVARVLTLTRVWEHPGIVVIAAIQDWTP